MGTKDPKDGSKPEAKQVEHGAKVTARRPFALVSMLLISKPDGLVTRDNAAYSPMYVDQYRKDQCDAVAPLKPALWLEWDG